MQLIAEIKRRNVHRIGLAYFAGSWLLIQVADTLFPVFGFGEGAVRMLVVVLAIGLVPMLALSWIFELTPAGLVLESEIDRSGAIKRTTGKQLDRVIIVVLAVAIAYFAFDKFVLSPQREARLIESAAQAGAERALEEERARSAAIPHESVAVLPFVNMSGDAQNEYFSDGLTETLLHMLAQLPDLKVSARTSAFSFKNKNVDIRTIALALGVAHVLEGSVQKAGNRVRVTAQLIRADDGFHLWSQNYDRTLDDVFAIQDEISTDVASALGSSLLTAESAGIRNIETANFSAYDIYLQALEQQNINTNEALLRADQLFAAALEKDPGFVDAKLGLARNYMWQYWKSAVRYSDPEEYRAAQTLVHEILAQRPDNLSAQVMDRLLQLYIGYTENKHWGKDETLEPLVDEMLVLAQQGHVDSFLTRLLVGITSGRDRDQEAMDLLRAALETDPLNTDLLQAQANLYHNTDRPEEAKQPLLTALKIAPENPELYRNLAWLALDQDSIVEALDWSRQALIADPEDPEIVARIAHRFYRFGLLSDGDFWFDRLRAMAPDRLDLIIDLEIESAAAAQDQDRLLEVLERALPLVLTAEADYFLTTIYYPSVMAAQGRPQEALDYLTELLPGIQDYTRLIDYSRFGQYMQVVSFGLQEDVLDEESFRRLTASLVTSVDALYPDWRDTSPDMNEIMVEAWLGNDDRARQVFLECHADWRMDSGQWLQLQIYPWLEELRQDPEVALAIEEYEQKKAAIAAELREMVKRPEWQLEE